MLETQIEKDLEPKMGNRGLRDTSGQWRIKWRSPGKEHGQRKKAGTTVRVACRVQGNIRVIMENQMETKIEN